MHQALNTKHRGKRRRSRAVLAESQTRAPAEAELERLLAGIARGSGICAKVNQQLAKHPGPSLTTLIELHRTMILNLTLKAEVDPEAFEMVIKLMRPVMDWERLEEKRKERELADRRRQDELEEKKAQREHPSDNVLLPEKLARIERELKLL